MPHAAVREECANRLVEIEQFVEPVHHQRLDVRRVDDDVARLHGRGVVRFGAQQCEHGAGCAGEERGGVVRLHAYANIGGVFEFLEDEFLHGVTRGQLPACRNAQAYTILAV